MYAKITSFLFVILFASNAFNQSTCATAYPKVNTTICSLSEHEIPIGDNQFWVQFTPVLGEKYQFFIDSIEKSVAISSVQLYSGTCSNLTLVQNFASVNLSDTLTTTSALAASQSYYLKLNFATTTALKNVVFCITPKTGDHYWTNYFYNQNGEYLNCETHYNPDITGNFPVGNLLCNEITLCVNETLNLTMSGPGHEYFDFIYGYDVEHIFQFIQQNGATAITSPDNLITQLSFSQPGDVTFFFIGIPWYDNYDIYPNLRPHVLYPDLFTFTIHVVDTYDEATWVDNSVLCAGQTSFLVPQIGTTLTSVKVDGITQNNLIQNNQVVINGSNYAAGTHTVQYTVTGACGPKTFTTTFQIITNNLVTSSMDGCGNATWNVTTCSSGQTLTLTVFDGNYNLEYTDDFPSQFGLNTFTYQFGNNGPFTWQIQLGNTVIGSGTFASIPPQMIPIISQDYICEVNNGFSVSPSTSIFDVTWSISPTVNFDGQGTYGIYQVGNWNQNLDYTVSVTGTDVNGCVYQGQKVINACCSKKVTGSEFFERTYVSTSDFPSTVLHATFNKAPTSVVIDLPTLPSVSTAVNTPYATSTTVTQLKVLLGLAPTAQLTNITNKWIYINNDLILDQNLVITNCPFIRFAPDARLIVPNGRALELSNSTLAAKCDEMWQGIVLEGANSLIKTNTNTNILEAKIAIESINGAKYEVNQTRFIDNAKGIVIRSFTGTHLGTITNSYFGDVVERNLLAPYQNNTRPLIGMEINRATCTIGTPNNNTSNRGGNLFHRVETGIRSIQANIVVRGNTFYRVILNHTDLTGSGMNDHRAIHATGPVLGTDPKNNLILGSLNSKLNCNNFIACGNAVYLRNNMNASIHSNFFRDIAYTGVWAENNANGNLAISSNFFASRNSDGYGVRIHQYSDGLLNIDKNQVNKAAYILNQGLPNEIVFTYLVAPHIGAGVYISNTAPGRTPAAPLVNITNNDISFAVYGALLYNVKKPNISYNKIDWNFTQATILSDLSYDYTGIFVGGCPYSIIKNNDIRNLQAFNPQTSPLGEFDLAGIRLENCFKSEVKFNYIHQVPAGLFSRFQNGQSEVHCNEFYKNLHGFKFDQTELGSQGFPAGVSVTYPFGFSADNKWTGVNTTSDRSDGSRINPSSSNSMKYYWFEGALVNSETKKSIPTYFLDVPNFYDDVLLPYVGNNRPFEGCMTAPQSIAVSDENLFRETAYGKFIDNAELTDEERAYAEREVYQKMTEDSAYLHLGMANDQKYIDFVNDYKTTDGALSLKVQTYIAADKRDSAAFFNAQISQADAYRINNKLVQSWYLESFNNADSIFAPTETTRLLIADLACQDPWVAGDAVYQARAIMGWLKPCDSDNNFGFKSGGIATNETEDMSVQVFPNPSFNEFTVTFPASEQVDLTLFDLNGKIIQHVHVTDATEYQFNHALKSGVYVLEIIRNNHVTTSKKIVVE